MLEHITLHPSYFPLQTHPPQSTSSTTVNIITPAMASLKQRVGSINTHNSLQNIPNLMPISSPIGTPKASSQASTARSSRYSTEHFPAIRPGLHGIQGFHHHTPMSATNQGKVQTEQQTSSANISSSPREWANKSVEEKQATPRVASTSWGQVMNSQTTEFVMEDMSVDMDAKLLCSFCPHPQDKALCIAMHSLGGPAFFKFQGLIHIPCEDSLVSRRQGIFGIQMLHLASLWPMGGPLGSSIAGAFGKNAFVYDLSSVSAKPSVTVPPKALWQAHDSPISCIYQSSFVCALFTGASDGCVRLWDMKSKPSNPVRQYLHKKHVTGIEMLDGRTICSSSLDGSIQLRDLRYGTSPFMSAIPDEKPILNMASLPLKNMIAFSSRGGLFCLQVASGNPTDADAAPGPSSSSSTPSMRVTSSLLWPLTPLPSVGPCTGIKWNTKTSTEIYTSELDGSITVFAK